MGVSNDGMSLCTGSWDSTVSLFIIQDFAVPRQADMDLLHSSRFGHGSYDANLVAGRCWDLRVKLFAVKSSARQLIYLIFGKHQANSMSESVRNIATTVLDATRQDRWTVIEWDGASSGLSIWSRHVSGNLIL